jgi:hypothetical protein
MNNVARVRNTLVVTGRLISKWITSSIFGVGCFKSVEVSQWINNIGTQCSILMISPGHLGDCTNKLIFSDKLTPS